MIEKNIDHNCSWHLPVDQAALHKTQLLSIRDSLKKMEIQSRDRPFLAKIISLFQHRVKTYVGIFTGSGPVQASPVGT